MNLETNEGADQDFLKKITSPFTKLIIQVNMMMLLLSASLSFLVHAGVFGLACQILNIFIYIISAYGEFKKM